jgi:Uma2 family endonuclease
MVEPAAARIAEQPLTMAQWLALGEDTRPTEVVDGQLVVTPSPYGPHQRVVFRLGVLLDAACPPGLEVLLGPADWILWEAPLLQVRQPDLMVVTAEEALRVPLRQPPRLVVEVVAGDSFERDVVTKRAEYARAGARHYWVVDIRDPDAIEVVAYCFDGERLAERARAVGDEQLSLDEPFPVVIRPASLVRPR